MLFLITKWFGCFLLDSNGNITDHILFPKEHEEIIKNLEIIKNNNILSEEKQLVSNNESIVVSEKRLQNIGTYDPTNLFFKNTIINGETYGYTQQDLVELSKKQAELIINRLLKLPDHQIIQIVHAVDDLIQTSNLLMERITAWSIFPNTDETLSPFKNLQEQTDNEIIRLQEIIKDKMEELTPNTTTLIGPLITARLIAHAGSMEKLAKLPASSIQLLGAEKALFRFKKEGGKPPKHGVIFQHTSICNAPRRLRGKFSRIIALKISLAIKADVFTKRFIAEDLKKDFINRMNDLKK